MSAAFQRIHELLSDLQHLDAGDSEAVAVAGHKILDCAQDSDLPDSASLLLRAAATQLHELGSVGGGAPISDIQRLVEAASAGVAEAEQLRSIPPFAHDALELAAHAAQILEKGSHTRRWDQRESLIPPDVDELMAHAQRVFRIPRDGKLPEGLDIDEQAAAALSSPPAETTQPPAEDEGDVRADAAVGFDDELAVAGSERPTAGNGDTDPVSGAAEPPELPVESGPVAVADAQETTSQDGKLSVIEAEPVITVEDESSGSGSVEEPELPADAGVSEPAAEVPELWALAPSQGEPTAAAEEPTAAAEEPTAAAEEPMAAAEEPTAAAEEPTAAAEEPTAEEPAAQEAASVAASPPEEEPEPMAPEEQELLLEFGVEAREYLEAAEAALLCLEDDVSNKEAIDTVFRAFHTVKGVAALLGLTVIAEFAHAAETLLSRVRSNETAYDSRTANLALRSVDLMGGFIRQACEQFTDRRLALPDDFQALCASLLDDSVDVPVPVVPNAPPPPVAELAPTPPGEVPKTPPQASRQPEEEERSGQTKAEAWMRVRTDRLDSLMDIVGELVIIQSMVSEDQMLSNPLMSQLRRKISRSEKIVRELQDLTLSLRMVPLQGVFRKMNRVLRDTAQKTKKRATLITEGADTEIDRNMVDSLSDPLVHMVRNAVDHGLETPEERVAVGKSAAGTVRLRAYKASGNVVVELSDDGKGLSPEALAKRAIDRGIISPDHGLSEAQIFNLIFAPGFSTAEKVTDVSGRGVGMDVVRRSIESLNGRVEITSVLGQGTTFCVRLPLTLAITDGMLLRVGQERYIIPTSSIGMSLRPERSQLKTVSGKGELLLLRGQPIPLFRMDRVMGIPGGVTDPCQGLLVLVNDGVQTVAFLVDALLGKQQAVTKSLGEGIGKVPGILGGAILSDGRVGLILDPPGLVALAQQTGAGAKHAA